MRWMIMPIVLSIAACAQMSEPSTRVSMAKAQTTETTWQDGQGRTLSAADMEQAYRACQNQQFRPQRAAAAMNLPLEDEFDRFALSDPEFDVCMQSFGLHRVDAPADQKPVPG
ncbi:MAG: hypothetical protein JWL84_688 [Rhodospirillales bacterium]|jgi:hypothetical protein|nr:hypothetical protein [Rhodospirillales bacterium]